METNFRVYNTKKEITMKKIIIFVLFATIVFNANSQQMQCTWVNQIGGPGWDVVTGMTQLKDSQLVITGSFYDKISFSTDTLLSNGSRDIFIARYQKDGTLVKAVSFGGAGYDYVKRVEPSGKDGFVMPIQFNQDIEIGGQKFESRYSNNLMLAWFDNKLDIAAHSLISSNGKFDITGLKTTPNGNFCFSGWFTDTLVAGNKEYVSRNAEDIFVGSISPQGKLKWLKHYEGDGADLSSSFIPGNDSIYYLAGLSAKGLSEGKKTPVPIPDGMSSLFISQISHSGKEKDIDFPLYGYDLVPVEILKDSLSVWILANFKHSAFLHKNEIASAGQSDVLLLKYNPEDHSVHYCRLGGKGNEKATGLVKSGDHIVVTGQFTDSLIFAGQRVVAVKQGSDIFIASVSLDCQPEDIISLAGEGLEFPCAMFADGTGIYIAGEFTGKMKVGAYELESNGEEDLFLARIENCRLRKPVEVIVKTFDDGLASQSWDLDAGAGYLDYNWNDSASVSRYFTALQAGTYKVTVTDTMGCVCSGEINISKTKSAKISPDMEEECEFKLFPTITSGIVYWQPASVWGAAKASVRIFDPVGRSIGSHVINELDKTVYQIDFSGKPEGVYLVEIAGDGFREKAKVIIKK